MRVAAFPQNFAGQLALAFAAGGIGVLAFRPFQAWPLAIVSLFLLFALLARVGSTWRGWMLGYSFGMGLFIFGVPWIYTSLHDFGGMPVVLAAAATFLFACYLALFPALFAASHCYLVRRFSVAPPAALLLIMPAGFVLWEYIRGNFFSGFPWLVFGYSQTPGGMWFAPLMGYAPLLGVFGIGGLLAFTAGAGVWITTAGSRKRRALLVSLIGLWVAGALLHRYPWSAPIGAPIAVSLLQGNVPQSLKWREEQLPVTLDNYYRLVVASRATLVVLPETALSASLHDVPSEYLAALKRHLEKNGGDVIAGVTIVERGASKQAPYIVSNSAISLGQSPPQRYDKQHLVVFGEFIPPLFSWVYRWLQIPVGDMAAGRADQQPMRVAGQAVGVNICYEDAFGAELSRQLPEATLLVNMSNMAWFGAYLAADQQTQFSQMRSLELGRWMLRATNTGVTAAINEQGEIVGALPQFVRGALEVSVQPRSGTTPYVRWNDWMILSIALLAMLVGCRIKRQDRDSARLAAGKWL